MEPDGVVLASDEGDSFMLGANRVWIKADGKDTSDTYSVTEFEMAPNPAPGSPHRHPDWDEAFVVIDGEVDCLIGEDVVRARAGSFILIPRNVAHRVWNAGDRPARILAIAQPWAPAYLRDMTEAFANGTPDVDRIKATYEKYGVEMVPG